MWAPKGLPLLSTQGGGGRCPRCPWSLCSGDGEPLPWAGHFLAPGSLAARVGHAAWGIVLEPAQHSGEGLRDGGLPALPVLVTGHLCRLSRELQEKERVIESLEAKLQERCESPGSSHLPSESSRSATSSSFVSEGLEPCSDGDAASECSQCHEEPARLAGTAGCPRATSCGGGHTVSL